MKTFVDVSKNRAVFGFVNRLNIVRECQQASSSLAHSLVQL